ncbi:hypothetical protein RUW10_22720 [Bacillus sp. IG2]|nr:hypothetical protein [Bacillus sp. IG2]
MCSDQGGMPWLLKEIRGRRSRYGASRRASEGENAPRLQGDQECTGSAAPCSASHRSCGGNRIREPARCRLFCVQSRKRAALAAEGDPRPPVPIWRLQESI